MKLVAIILNVFLLILVGVFVATAIMDRTAGYFAGFVAFLILGTPPIFTILTLYLSKSKSESESWLTLYFRRKAAEERKRIAQIEGNGDSQQPLERN